MQANPSLSKVADRIALSWRWTIRNEREVFINFNIVWNLIIALGCVYLARLISIQEDFGGLGNSVRFYVTAFTLFPSVLAVISSILLYLRHPIGRYLSLVIQFVGLLLAAVGLFHVWGAFLGFETTVDSIMRNARFLLGFPIAYAIYWVSSQLHEDSPLRAWLMKIAFAIGVWSVLLILTWHHVFNLIVNGFTTTQDSLIGIVLVLAGFSGVGFYISSFGEYNWKRSAFFLLSVVTILFGMLHTQMLGALNDILQSFNDPFENATPWFLLLGVLIFGTLGLRMLYMGQYFGETPDENAAWQGWLLLSPNIFGFMLFFAGPLLLSFYLSFSDSTAGATPNDIGLENYRKILSLETQWLDQRNYNAIPLLQLTQSSTPALDHLSVVRRSAQSVMSFGYRPLGTIHLGENVRLVIGAKDYRFWISLRNTLMFCMLLVPLSTIPAIGLALILNSKLPGVKFFRAMYFLPSVAAVVGTALIWRWLYDPTIGFFNYFISEFVDFINSTFGTSIQDPAIQWLTGPGVVLFSIVFLAAWQVVGFNTVLFLAGLQGIPKSLYEAAQIDGANRWQQFTNVTMPMLAPTTFFVVITTIITGLQVFNEPYALFPSRPIPENATTAVFYLYTSGFQDFQFGYASAVAWVLFFIIFGITLLQFRLSRSEAYES
ncbi:MAG: hypothetical protein CUN56_09845, partial [Phototrophicales bacterium]